MSTITIAGISIGDWHLTQTAGTGVVQLRIYATQSFLTSAGTIVPGGSPTGGALYQTIPCDVAGPDANGNYTLTIPSITIDSTTDSPDPVSTSARYVTWFFAGKRLLAPAVLGGPTGSFRILPVYSTIPATWADIWLDNTQGAIQSYDLTTYTKEQINYLISQGVGSAGISSLNGLTAAMQYFANDTNVTIVSATDTHTITWAGQLAVARGGTAATTAAGARTNLGAAASGANSDITSLTGLTTPLGAAFGGTGQLGGYTVGDLLYASGASALSKLASAAGVLAASGAASAPAYTTAPTITSLTLSSLTAGRVVYAGTAGLLSDESLFLWDAATHRLSLGVVDSTNTINLANASYLSGRGTVAAAQVRIAAIADQTKYTGVATSTTVDAITFGAAVPVAQVFTDGGASALNPLAPDYQVRAAGIRVGTGLAGAYNDSSSSNIFHFSSVVTSIGSAPTVAGFFEATGLAAGANVFAFNPVSYLDLAGTTAGTARAAEFNFGGLGVSPNQEVYGLKLVSNAGASTPAGVIRSFIEMERTGTASTYDGAKALNGIVFNDASGQAVSSALITGQGTTATYVGLFTGGTYATGIDFATSTFSSSNQIRLANGGATSSGIRAHNNGGSADFNVARMTTGDYLEYGDGTAGVVGMRFLVSAGSSDTLRFLGGATGLPGNAGWNQAVPTAQQHVTAINKRTLTGGATFTINNGSPNVVATGSAFTTELAPGNSIEFDSQAGTIYTVLSITSDTALTLTANYTGSNSITATAKSDYRTLLIESASGEDWLELSNQHALRLYGNSLFGDERGLLAMVARANTNQKLLFGVDSISGYGYISSLESTVGWKPLFLQAGAAGTAVGGVVIGTASPSSLGAMLKVEGAQTNPGANNTGSEFNNLSTSTGYFQKISASYQGIGSWVGPNIGVFTITTGGVDASAEDLTNVPLAAFGGKNYFGPYSTQITSPAPPVNLFTAIVDVYGVPTDSITRGTDTATTHATTTVDGSGTTWNTAGAADRVRAGDSILLGTDTEVYTVANVVSDTQLTLSASYAGTPASGIEAHRDPYLLRVRNSYGTERFRVESSGLTALGGKLRLLPATSGTITAANTISVADVVGNVVHITGATTIKTINGGEAGDLIALVFDSTPTVDETGNVLVAGGSFIATANSMLVLYYDGTLSKWLQWGGFIN